MSKHNKPGSVQHQQASATKDGERQKENTNRHVYIEPGAQIDIVDSLKQQHSTEREEDKTHQKRQLFWTKAAAILVAAYTIITLWEGISIRSQLTATQRQLHDSEVEQRAKLTVDGFEPERVETTGGMIRIKGKWVVTNTGPTVALIVFQNTSSGVARGGIGPTHFQGARAGINDKEPEGGNWLRVDAKHEIPIDAWSGSVANAEALDQRTFYFEIDMSLAYKDIFGHVWWIDDCYLYDAVTPSKLRHCAITARIPPEDYANESQKKTPWWARPLAWFIAALSSRI